MAASNVLYSIMYGERRGYEDPGMHFQMEKLNQIFKTVAVGGTAQMFPFILNLPFDILGFWKLAARVQKASARQRQRVTQHRQS